jgi:amino acid ABC transporter substrate-binding protein, PAAT family (TC 3.A.1.3.-)
MANMCPPQTAWLNPSVWAVFAALSNVLPNDDGSLVFRYNGSPAEHSAALHASGVQRFFYSFSDKVVMNPLKTILSALGLAALIATGAHAQNKELVVGSSATYRPFAYESPTKEIVGYDIDMIKAIAQKAGLQIKIVNTPWTGIFAALNNGDVDLIISGVTINEKRKQSYDFTTPYFEARQLIGVHKDSTAKNLKDLAGKKVGVVTGTTGGRHRLA